MSKQADIIAKLNTINLNKEVLGSLQIVSKFLENILFTLRILHCEITIESLQFLELTYKSPLRRKLYSQGMSFA